MEQYRSLTLSKEINMKYLIAIWAIASASLAYASCTTNTTYYNGRYVTCTTCCYGGNCTTNCY